jgi:regulator of sigma E protease
MTQLLYILAVAFGIGLLIYLHELGHYVCARMIGVRVEVFSLGFGPRLWGFRRGATDYRISAVPLGGYVAVAGQDPSDRRYPASQCLWSKSVGQRALYFAGGVVMNLLFALVAFPIVFHSGVEFIAPEVGSVFPGSPAWEARLQPGDKIVALDGKPMYSFENLDAEVALAGPRTIRLRVERNNQELVVEAEPRFESDAGLYRLGINYPIVQREPTLSIRAGTPADLAGLRTGDVLLSWNGHPILGRPVLPEEVDHTLDTEVSVRRDGKELTIRIPPTPIDPSQPPVIGVNPFPYVVSGLRPGLPALQTLGLQRGDHLLAVDGHPFHGPDLSVAAEGSDRLTLRVRRNGEERELAAPVTPADRKAIADYVAFTTDLGSSLLLPHPGGAAANAGMQPGDEVIAIDGQPVHDWESLRSKVLAAAAGTVLHFTVRRDGAEVPLAIAPQAQRVDLGVVTMVPTKMTEVRQDSFAGAVRAGTVAAVDLIKQLYVTIKGMITGQVGAKNLGGIITISRVSYQVAQGGPSRFFFFLALLSINLAFINVLPIPVLDGGYLLFLLIEKIKGSPVSPRVFGYSQILGLVFVLALVVFVTYNDILRLL